MIALECSIFTSNQKKFIILNYFIIKVNKKQWVFKVLGLSHELMVIGTNSAGNAITCKVNLYQKHRYLHCKKMCVQELQATVTITAIERSDI